MRVSRRSSLRRQCSLSWSSGFVSSLLALLAIAASLFAHEPGLSTASIRLAPDAARAQLTLAWRDAAVLTPLDTNDDGDLDETEITAAQSALDALAVQAVELRADSTAVTPFHTRAWVDETNNVQLELEFPLRSPRQVTLHSPFIDRLPANHRQFVVLLDSTNAVLAEVLLSANEDVIDLDLQALFPPTTFRDFFKLGLEHIATGYDHLLFLFGLLLVTPRFRTAAILITSFTLAHSLTLALAALDVVSLSPRVVEPLIAATILYVGVENLFFREGPKWRGALTFVFGLIHGLGFAGVLRELGIGSSGGGVLIPLLGFNLGVEVGQLAAAAIALPALFALLRWKPFQRRGVVTCSVLVALAGAGWLIARLSP